MIPNLYMYVIYRERERSGIRDQTLLPDQKGNLMKVHIYKNTHTQIYVDIYLPLRSIKCDSDRVFSLFQSPGKPPEVIRTASSVVPDGQFRRLDIAEDRNNFLLGFHEKRELMETEVRITIVRRKHRDSKLAVDNGGINFVKELISRLHGLGIQKRV